MYNQAWKSNKSIEIDEERLEMTSEEIDNAQEQAITLLHMVLDLWGKDENKSSAIFFETNPKYYDGAFYLANCSLVVYDDDDEEFFSEHRIIGIFNIKNALYFSINPTLNKESYEYVQQKLVNAKRAEEGDRVKHQVKEGKQ